MVCEVAGATDDFCSIGRMCGAVVLCAFNFVLVSIKSGLS